MRKAMSKIIPIAAFTMTLLLPTSGHAQDTIVGVWKAVSIETKELDTGKSIRPFGEPPNATFVFTNGGQMAAVITSADRKAPVAPNPTDAERADLHRTLSAYSGTYRVDGNKLIVTVRNSSIQSWNGTERSLALEFRGKLLHATSAPFKSTVSNGEVVAVNVWERVE